MKKHFLQIVMLTLLVSFIGCDENYTVDSEKLEKVDFKKYKTYAWLPSNDSITVGGIDRLQLINSIISNVDEQLFRRSFTVDTLKPDILVRFNIMMNNSTAIVTTPIYENQPTVSYGVGYGYGGYGRYGGYGTVGVYSQPVQVGQTVEQVPFRNGQLVIELIDRSLSKVVWRGYAYGSKEEEYRNAEISQMRKKVQKIVNDIFWKYPVRRK